MASRLQQAEIRIEADSLTIPAEAALENEQIDKATEAMETMSTAQGFEKEEDIVAARGEGSKSVQLGLAQAARQGIFCRNLEDESALLGEPPDLDHGLRRRERKNNQCSLECVAHDGAVLENKCKLQIKMQCLEGNGAGRAPHSPVRLGAKLKLHSERASSAGVPKEACEESPCTDKE